MEVNREYVADYKLNVICVISNPCLYKRRYKLANEFIERIGKNDKINLYVVELCYDNLSFMITNPKNKNHLQLRTKYPLWHKENMINLGVKHLLPSDWKSFAWIDADIEFLQDNWVEETLKLLKENDIVQLFKRAINLDKNNLPLSYKTGYAYDKINIYNKIVQTKGNFFISKQKKDYHTGFGWAINRELYDILGGLYENSIIGGGDKIMAYILSKNTNEYLKSRKFSEKFIESLLDYEKKIEKYDVKIGYIDCEIKHYYHGEFNKRKYIERFEILNKYDYDPKYHMFYDNNSIIQPTENCPKELIKEIYEYFKLRNEDEEFED